MTVAVPERTLPLCTPESMQKEQAYMARFGLEDVKLRLTPNITADFTARTDFAEADVDAQVLNLTRFPVYFPETREFFVGIRPDAPARDQRGAPIVVLVSTV